MSGYKTLLILAGVASLAVALFQAVISFFPDLSLYFGAPDWIVSDRTLLLGTGLLAAVIFGVFGLYGLGGAGLVRGLPWLRLGLVVTGLIYTIRGLAIVPVLLIRFGLVQTAEPLPEPAVISCLIPLTIGGLFLVGTWRGWSELSAIKSSRSLPDST